VLTRFLIALTVSVGVAAATGCSKNSGRARQEAFDAGNRYFSQQKYPEASVEFRKAVSLDPKFGEARGRLAETYVKLGDLGNAYREYVRAADLKPDDVELQVRAASFLLAAGQYEDAQTRIRKALAKEPTNTTAHIIYGSALAGMKNFDSALDEIEKAVVAEPSAAGYASLAQVRMNMGNQVEAEAAFKRAVAVDPNSVIARLSLANFYWAAGRTAEAERSFREAVEAKPDDALANRALATFLLGSGRASQAEPYLKAAAAKDDTPDSSQRLALADYYITFEKPDQAVEVLRAIKASTSDRVAARASTRLAYIDYLQKRSTTAYQTLNDVLRADPGNSEALITKARLQASDHKLNDALATVTQATKVDPTNTQALFLAATIHTEMGNVEPAIKAYNEVLKLSPRSAVVKARLAQLLTVKGDADSALSFAQEAYDLDRANADAQLALARSLIAKRESARAAPLVKALVAANPNSALIHSTSAAYSVNVEDWKTAEREFAHALELAPSDVEAFSGLVGVYLQTSQQGPLRTLLEERLKQMPDHSPSLVIAAAGFLSLNDIPRGKALLEKAITVDPSNLRAYEMLGRLLAAQGQLDSARSQFEQLAAKNPTGAGPRTMLGMVLELQHKRDAASKQYEEALRLDSNAAVAANNLATYYADNGERLDIALDLAQTAVRQLPEHGSAADTLGWVYIKRELPALAVEPLRRATQIDPKNPTFQYHLGLAYAKSGDKVRAKEALTKALSLQAEFPEAADAKRALSSL